MPTYKLNSTLDGSTICDRMILWKKLTNAFLSFCICFDPHPLGRLERAWSSLEEEDEGQRSAKFGYCRS